MPSSIPELGHFAEPALLILIAMALGSIAGAFLGAQALTIVPHAALPPILAVILILSAMVGAIVVANLPRLRTAFARTPGL